MHTKIRRRIIRMAVLLIAFGGTARCTTYGGQGSEQAVYEQIKIANEVFAEDLERARAGVERLREAAVRDPSAAAHAERYWAILQGHEVMLQAHRVQQERLSAGDGHQKLHRVFGSVLASQQVVRDRYQAFWRLVEDADSEGGDYVRAAVSSSQYVFKPPFYRRLEPEAYRFAFRGPRSEAAGEQMLPEGEIEDE